VCVSRSLSRARAYVCVCVCARVCVGVGVGVDVCVWCLCVYRCPCLCGQGLSYLPRRESQMLKLAGLNLEHNRLETAPFELFQSATLKKIRLAGNDALLSPPQVGHSMSKNP